MKAIIYLKYEGSLEELGTELSEGLNLPDFWLKTDQDPPHALTALNECFGCELWLFKSSDIQNFQFRLDVEGYTDISKEKIEIDVSEWLSNSISELCEIETYINKKA